MGKIDKGKYALWYAGDKKLGYGGTSFIIRGQFKEKVQQFRASGRIAYIRIENQRQSASLINVLYAPTEKDKEEEAILDDYIG